ncbi:MAG TPA: FAD-linked oxidase C-terminal domain-containing protein [Streptosporangiaceae bacterium]
MPDPGPRSATRTATTASAGRALGEDLAAKVRGEVRFDRTSRSLFAADASNYRHVPVGVVQPVDLDDVLTTLEICRRHEVSILPRGAATSIGGQAVNEAVVIDFSRHLREVLEIDPERRLARVQPGVVLDDLRAAAAPFGLTFGPDPSTHSRCTIGGMIGNNACGSHSVAWGKTVDNVASLDVITFDGTRLQAGPVTPAELRARAAAGGEVGRIYQRVAAMAGGLGAVIRAQTPKLTRRVSGYNLDQLLPENACNLARALTGTEGTCVTVLAATVTLVPLPVSRALTVVGFRDAFAAADAAPGFLDLAPLTIEGMDVSLIAALRAARPADERHRLLPEGEGWLFIETGGSSAAEAQAAAAGIAARGAELGGVATTVVDPARMRSLWAIREAGAGILTRGADGREAWPGWEDAAVPPERLGAYLRDFRKLLDDHGRRGAYYGHFGDGCVHVRIDFDLLSQPGIAAFRRFVEEAADLVTAHGGSLSGEHGDGQARAELLPRMYPAEMIEAFAEFKDIWDPQDKMNPGTVVRPRRLDADLRVHVEGPRPGGRTHLALAHDGGSLEAAARRCVGVGACLSSHGGVMCPSYRATGDEQHSTRGRARLLFEFASGRSGLDAAHADDVAGALDLCLSCKGCKSECPVGVDIAAYKSEFLAQRYAGRIRPSAHYALGWLPTWLRLLASTRTTGLANRAARRPALASAGKRLGGIAAERDIPPLAAESLQSWFHRRGSGGRPPGSVTPERRLVLWPDTFTNYLEPEIGRAAVAALEALGYQVELPRRPVCCGLTWVSTGQLGTAKRVLARTLRTMGPWLAAGVPIVGLEPSCTAALRAEATELLPGNPAAAQLAAGVRTLAEVLQPHAAELSAATGEDANGASAAGDTPRTRHRGGSRQAIAQVHCHQHADLGYDPDREVLAALGVRTEVLDSGCCGLAGNFGFERGHYEISQACAERVLYPAVRAAADDVQVIADGYSCRTQIRQGTGAKPVHLAQIAAAALQPAGGAEPPATGSG